MYEKQKKVHPSFHKKEEDWMRLRVEGENVSEWKWEPVSRNVVGGLGHMV